MTIAYCLRQQNGAIAITTTTVRNPSRHLIDGSDFISSLPDALLHLILTSIPTKTAIRTSTLSKRWRYVWCETPSLSIDSIRTQPDSITKTLTSFFTATKINSFYLRTSLLNRINSVNTWIDFAKSHSPKNLSLEIRDSRVKNYEFPDSFYNNPDVTEITIDSGSVVMIPNCNVCWSSLRTLSLSNCKLSDESILRILAGCPILETLELLYCEEFRRLDLRSFPSIKTLDIDRSDLFSGSTEIVAPYVQSLRLRHSRLPCSLVDVSSLKEADLNIYFYDLASLTVDFLQRYVLRLLKKLQNVKKLTFGATFLQILSLVALNGVQFPTLKVEDLVLETMIIRSVIPGIAKLLQNSPGLRKLTIHTVKCSIISERHLNDYLRLQSMTPQQLRQRQCWGAKDTTVFPGSIETISMLLGKHAETKLVASFIELLLKNTTSLETMVVLLVGYLDASGLEELLKMATKLSRNNNNVSICIKRSNVQCVSNSF